MEIDTLISQQNPHWSDKNYLPTEMGWFHRYLWQEIKSWLGKRFIISLTGLRRVGKSTIMKQILGDLIKQGKAKQCLYFSFDKLQLKRDPDNLKKIIDYYLEEVLGEKIHEIKEKVYLFLDEIQKIPNFEEVIKFYYDLNKHLKFIVSGSSSLFIQKKSSESLGGRIINLKLYPLSFKEYLKLTKPSYEVMVNDKQWVLQNIGILNGYFANYLKLGQFPEIITQKLTESQAKEYLSSIEEKITQEDLPRIYPIKHPEILSLFVNQIKEYPGQRVEYHSVSKEAGLDERTCSKYFSYLEKGFLIFLCRNFGKKPLKALRVAKKAYLASSNFGVFSNLSLLAENYIFNYWQKQGTEIYFLKDQEIDFVAVTKEKNLIISEVKYQNQIDLRDIKNLEAFMSINKIHKAFLFTKNYFRPKGKVVFLPVSLAEFYT